MKINVSIIEEGCEFALVNRQIEIPDDGHVREHVANAFDESDYKIVRIHNTKKSCLVYVESQNGF